jgi:Tat protein secretion system quality control protein TatD with DNase activity
MQHCNLLFHLRDACDYIAYVLTQPPKTTADGIVAKPAVLVHCFKGISRSASAVIAYVMRDMKLPYHETMKILKQRRGCIWPS